jgi:rubrerythrin
MPVKKKTKKTAKKAPAKKTKKAAPKKKAAAKVKKGQAYECRVCGYRVIVDRVCGCAEEHVLVCCGKPMLKKRA